VGPARTEKMIQIDGSQGEGGGQILRSALALSLVTGRPFQMTRIRSGRQKPGLLRQHLTAVQAAATIGGARVSGAELGSAVLEFTPSRIEPGEYRFAVGTAGSATLVLQAVLPALLTASAPSRLTVEGGTHNPNAPPFDFLSKTFVPLIRRMGASIDLALDTHGFYPAGGGRFTVAVEPSGRLRPIALLERGEVSIRARALIAELPEQIAKRELAVVRERLGLDRWECRIEEVPTSAGPGNVLMIEAASPEVTELVTGFGMKGVTAERVASDACDEIGAYLAAGVPVATHLADQLLLPMALAGGGVFRTTTPSSHTATNAKVIGQFLDLPITIEQELDNIYRVAMGTTIEDSTS
jgi:RNA 3'-terminal phosphate cyclase (ATP)